MPRKYKGAREGYEPVDLTGAVGFDNYHKLSIEERKERRNKNRTSKQSRKWHRRRNKHGRQSAT